MLGIELKNINNCTKTVSENVCTKNFIQKEDDNIFAATARNIGMDKFADFLRDDWSANIARKAGFEDFANWLDNKSATGEELDNNGFFSNLAREAIKHPVITIATIASSIFLGKKIAHVIKNSGVNNKINTITNSQGVSSASSAIVTPSTTIKSVTKQHVPEYQLQEIIDEGLKYEQKINFSNLEIFKDVTPEARQRIINHFAYPIHQERFLYFASGAKPGLLEKPYFDDVFDVLRGDTVKVIECFDKKAGVLILNKNSAKNIIKSNKKLFTQRLGLPETTSVDEIFSLINKTSSGPLSDAKKYLDLRLLLTGSLKENATLAQIFEDITKAEKNSRMNVGFVSFYNKSAKGLDSFKQALIDNVKSSKSSYATMPEGYKNEVLKIIDSISTEEYARRLGDPIEIFQGNTYKTKRLQSLSILAEKLDGVCKTGAPIKLT